MKTVLGLALAAAVTLGSIYVYQKLTGKSVADLGRAS